MRSRLVFFISGLGLLVALVSAYLFAQQPSTLPPAFTPAANPYANGIYAEGIVESMQAQGENINMYPEVTGAITHVMVAEGDRVRQGEPLLMIDDTVQRATAEQQQSQAQAAQTMLKELKAEPRPEALDVAAAQVANAKATLKSAKDQLTKEQRSYDMDAKSVSQNNLDNAKNAELVAVTNLEVVQKQYDLTRAGAWVFDIQNQEKQYLALSKAYSASAALLGKYTIRAPMDGVVRSIQASIGSYVSPQGAYDAYTQGFDPLIVMGSPDDQLQVRVYVDEILIHRLSGFSKLDAQMFIRGTTVHLPLTFTRIQPYVSPKIELSDERTERVDLRVLPLIFRFERPKDQIIYPGELVDVYVSPK
jgi:HlyD family secretion protein